MTGGRPTGSHASNRMRLGLSLAGLLLLTPATAHAALDGLFDPLSQGLPSTTTQLDPLPPVIDLVEETIQPPLEIVEEVVDQIEEIVVPTVEPPPDLPDIVEAPPQDVFGGEAFDLESNDPATDDLVVGVDSVDVLAIQPSDMLAADDRGLKRLERSLLTIDPAESIAPINPGASSVDTGWLSRLKAWLPPVLAGLVDVLAAPVKLLWLLLRALTSSGRWLLAPASILIALAFMMLVDRSERSLSSMRRELAGVANRQPSR